MGPHRSIRTVARSFPPAGYTAALKSGRLPGIAMAMRVVAFANSDGTEPTVTQEDVHEYEEVLESTLEGSGIIVNTTYKLITPIFSRCNFFTPRIIVLMGVLDASVLSYCASSCISLWRCLAIGTPN
jgi:hypothetical protein